MGNSIRKTKLNTVQDLRESGFGQPSPRHGLKLLFWLANECVELDRQDNMVSGCEPRRGDFGFHHFGNFEKILPSLLPGEGQKYFVVGNLNPEKHPGAQDLPDYVREDYDRPQISHASNKDRIILALLPGNGISKIYVTEHLDRSQGFDRKRTFRVTASLVSDIKDPELDLAAFLRQTGFYSAPFRRYAIVLGCVILLLCLIAVLYVIFTQL
ncbi:uncharacterized protein LOC118769515 [Megalops cyprinoides]|uniref:uncharacterized protein LOC118769515 n=1 Tax=Megalops cyprinoides TaxID=118141 RepID=UPI001864D9C7|nr:uncharacterized protein LOC118769515 [Megalops cyprinoides]